MLKNSLFRSHVCHISCDNESKRKKKKKQHRNNHNSRFTKKFLTSSFGCSNSHFKILVSALTENERKKKITSTKNQENTILPAIEDIAVASSFSFLCQRNIECYWFECPNLAMNTTIRNQNNNNIRLE